MMKRISMTKRAAKSVLLPMLAFLIFAAVMPAGADAGTAAVKTAETFTGDFIDLGDAELTADTPYYVNGKAAARGSLGKDGCTAYFDASSKTLTLQDATIISGSGDNEYLSNNSGTYHKGVIDYYGAETRSDDVTIILNGHNTVKSNNPKYYCGIQVTCPTSVYKPDLYFKGSGSLDIATCDTSSEVNRGIRVENNIFFDGGDIAIRNGDNIGSSDSEYCENTAISSVGGNVQINDGTVTAEAGTSYNYFSYGISAQFVTVRGGILDAKGGKVRGTLPTGKQRIDAAKAYRSTIHMQVKI